MSRNTTIIVVVVLVVLCCLGLIAAGVLASVVYLLPGRVSTSTGPEGPAVRVGEPPAEALGYFGCMGYESGTLSTAGFLTVDENGDASFVDYDGQESTGTWTYDDGTSSFAFSEDLPLETAELQSDGTLAGTVRPDAELSHAETGEVTCHPTSP